MNLTDFLAKQPLATKCPRIGFESEILEHFDAYVVQMADNKRVVIVSDHDYRDYAERKLMPSLALHGLDASYCLVVRSVESYEDQVRNAISRLDAASLIVALGDEDILHAARAAAAKNNISAALAVCSACPSRDFFLERQDEISCKLSAIYFDLKSIAELSPSDWRELTSAIELFSNAFLLEAHVADALAKPEARNVRLAIAEIDDCRSADKDDPEAVAQVCEAMAWLAAARAALGNETSLDFVMRYAAACTQRMPMPVQDHAAILVRLIDAFTQVESLEIDADDCAAHQLPRDILKRTLKQTLLEDEVSFDWLKNADDAWLDRIAVRTCVHTLTSNWDDLCEQLSIRSAMIHAALEDRPASDDATSLADAWVHAARFAPKYSFVNIMALLRLLEGALFD